MPDMIRVQVGGFEGQASRATLLVWDAYVKLTPNERGMFKTLALDARLVGAPVAAVVEEVQEPQEGSKP
jgi:hypothetical protein